MYKTDSKRTTQDAYKHQMYLQASHWSVCSLSVPDVPLYAPPLILLRFTLIDTV